MCGILAVLNSTDDSPAMRSRVLSLSRRQMHRGPDCSGMHKKGNNFLAHKRLTIIGPPRHTNPPIPLVTRSVPSTPLDLALLRDTFTKAVEKRLMSDVPFGLDILLGGLASVAKRILGKEGTIWGTKLHSFCVGLPGAPDLKAARQVADFLGTDHHEFNFTVQTFDREPLSIRASTPMFLMSRKIKAIGVKMGVGEGAVV
eukprot:gene1783-33201_t